MADTVKVVEPKNGVFLLDNKIKIERFDDLNYIVKIKSDTEVADKVSSSRGTTYVYKSDGYKRYKRSYFSSVEQALRYVLEKIVPELALEESSYDLKSFVEEIKRAKESIVSDVLKQKAI